VILLETSGKNFLDVNGAKVDASGSNGQAGTWLLDPTNINIVTAGTGTLTGGIFDPATNSTIAPTTIESALNSGTNVTITTANGTGGSGDITLTNSIGQTLGGSASLTLTGRQFFRGPYGTINMTSTGALTFNINQINPETTAPNSSIQNAINAIGIVTGGTTINLGAGTYTGNTVFINKPLTINGADLTNTNTILDAQNNNSVFQISSSDTVTLNNFTILNGNASFFYGGAIYKTTSNTLNINNLAFNNNSASSNGGAIYNSEGTINIINSTFNNNNSVFSDGGAIYNSDGTINITNSNFNNNSAFSDGGAIYTSDGIINTTNSIFSNNTVTNNGGAIYNSSGTLTINNSTLSGNSSTLDGGAIYHQGLNNSTVFVNNSTFSGNTAISGGAIYHQGLNNSTVFVSNSTFSGNTANSGGAIYNSDGDIYINSGTLSSNTASINGGGIYNSDFGNIFLNNTIVAGNTSSTSPDIFGSVNSESNYNLIGNGTGIGINNGDNGNLVGSNIAPIDPKLAVLGDYGGTTQTMALLPDSPAINAGILDPDFTTDQRGISRPQGAAPDIGAFEVVGYTLTPIAGSGQTTTINTTFGTNLQAKVTEDGFDKAIPNVSVTFNAPDSGASANFTGSNTLITDSSGIVSISVTANSIAGSYSISANSGILTPANFSLTNQNQVDNSFEPTTIINTNPGNNSINKENQTNSTGGTDEKFTDEFKQYLSIEENTEVVSVNEAREILTKINNATGVQPALIYVNFVPTTISGEASQILKSDSDRLELLIVTSKGEPIRKVINVTRSQVMEVASSFRGAITDNTLRRNYKQPGKQLYDWLIQPIESELQEQKIDNLVFIMDGGLRSLPIAALYDGEKHLVERYSVGLMPSLSLTDTNYVDIKKAQVLGMGASTFIDQDPLPAVPTELSAITNQLWTGKSFLNESFTLKNLQNQRKEIPYGIIHLATHGEFQSGSPSNSYIQLWDTQLKMNQLRQLGWNNPPVELVVLSACRTAIGDEHAELGFAGFAVQAGAKSALASLWYVSDEGTLGLMSEFYKQLKTSPIKAEALRQAQIAMLKGEVRIQDGKLRISRGDVNLPPLLKRIGNKDLQHPYFWSAFTMIGNPW
jgi:predicted outer membrane repeat protein